MLYLSTKLYNIPLLSLRSAGRIGSVIKPIINPHNLHIDGFYCQVPGHKENLILLDIHIRDLSPKGIIIDDNRDLSEPDELVRLKPILKIDFQILDKSVVSSKRKIGKLTEYAIDLKSMFIQKLYVQPAIWQSLNQQQLTFDRNSVIEVTDKHIIVSGPEEKATKTKKIPNSQAQVNYSASTSLISE